MDSPMTIDVAILCSLVLLLAWANGANDVSRGVATLAGSGIAGARRAILWGTAWTFLGGMAAVVWGAALVETFSRGFVAPDFPASTLFVAAALFQRPTSAPARCSVCVWQGGVKDHPLLTSGEHKCGTAFVASEHSPC
jgi:hypothetical protein